MKLACRLNWHRWKKWVTSPVTADPIDQSVIAGQIRQCADCWLVQTRTFGRDIAFNMRPLRDAIRSHIEDLARCVQVIAESDYATELESTRKQIETAIKELSEALRVDEGAPASK